jgi:Cu(I)/Ag(I) efflux system periplasmic protein CusF
MNRFVSGLVAAVLAASAMAQTPSASGEVAKLDKAANRITLKHTGIKHLDMPPMSMVFRVRDPAVMSGLAVGDRVRFVAEKVDGQYTVTAVTKAP